MKKCELCGKGHDGDYASGRFCSSFCSRGFSTKEKRIEINKKVSNILKNKQILNPKSRNGIFKKKCPICYKEFETWKSENHIYCSKECLLKDKEYKFRKRPKTGGYRKNSGRSKGGYYNGIWCQSTYELVYVVYNLEHNIDFKRNEKRFKYIKNGIEREYLPDFIEGEFIIEIKGYYTQDVDIKKNCVNMPIKVLYKKDIQYMFDYVIGKYGFNLLKLYNDYKPQFKYVCLNCGKEFNSDRKRKTNAIFCSRKCAGTYITNKNRVDL